MKKFKFATPEKTEEGIPFIQFELVDALKSTCQDDPIDSKLAKKITCASACNFQIMYANDDTTNLISSSPNIGLKRCIASMCRSGAGYDSATSLVVVSKYLLHGQIALALISYTNVVRIQDVSFYNVYDSIDINLKTYIEMVYDYISSL